MKGTFKRFSSCLLAAAVLAGSCAFGTGSSVKAQAASTDFDESNIVLSFAALGDTHIQGSADYDSTVKFRKALAQLQNRAKADNKTLDAIILNGDITDYGTTDQISLLNDALQTRISKGLDLTKTKLLLSMGNHEIYSAELDDGDNGIGDTQAQAVPHYHGGTTFKNILGDKMYTGDNTAEQIESGFLHTVINGYHFINFSLYNYDHGLRYEPKELQWLKDALAEANAEDPNKPIFFAMHCAVYGTTLGSYSGDYWALNDSTFYDVLKQYPQLVTFGSHLHYPEQDERAIYQKDFTSIDLGSTYYNSLVTDTTNPTTGDTVKYANLNGSEPTDCMNQSEGTYIQVDKNNNVRVVRLDFYKGETTGAQIKQPWIIPSPSNPDHLKVYTDEAHKAGNTAPTFASGAKVTVTPYDKVNDPNHLTVTFDQATDNDMVLYYEIKYIDKTTGKTINTMYTYSDYYLHPNPSEMAPSLTFKGEKRSIYPMKPNYPNDYVVQVRAVDCYGMMSNPITSDTVPGDPSGNIEVPAPSLDPQDNWQFKSFTDFDYLTDGYTPQRSVDFDSWPTADAADFHPYVPVSNNGFNNTPAITKKINGSANEFDVWSYKGSDDEFAKRINTDFDGAVEFWAWVDFSQVNFDECYFGFRSQVFYGGETEYITEVSSAIQGVHYYIQDGNGGWIQKDFTSNGSMAIGGYKGFIRFAVEDFYNAEQNPMYPVGLKTLKFWFSPATDQDYTGKTFTIDQVGFAGPSISGSTMTVGQMKSQDGSAVVTSQELSAACTLAKTKIDAGQKDYSSETWTAFNNAYTAAAGLSSTASAADIQSAYSALKTAQNALAALAPTTTTETTTTDTSTTVTSATDTTATESTATEPSATETSATEPSSTTVTSASSTQSVTQPTATTSETAATETQSEETTAASEETTTTAAASPNTGHSAPIAVGALALLAVACGAAVYKKKQ